jgi:hypothetical protein
VRSVLETTNTNDAPHVIELDVAPDNVGRLPLRRGLQWRFRMVKHVCLYSTEVSLAKPLVAACLYSTEVSLASTTSSRYRACHFVASRGHLRFQASHWLVSAVSVLASSINKCSDGVARSTRHEHNRNSAAMIKWPPGPNICFKNASSGNRWKNAYRLAHRNGVKIPSAEAKPSYAAESSPRLTTHASR